MNRTSRNSTLLLCSAVMTALLAGCSSHSPVASAGSTPAAQEPTQTADALGKIEGRVARSPRNAALRVELAQAYLAAGRFDSAATTFEDAAALGGLSARGGLSQALAYIGSGRDAQALDLLGRLRTQLTAGDYGLALALAGQPAQGVAVISNALRAGENTPTMRQNLAYAYALDGRWMAARVVALQDVPADQIDARLTEWGAFARPGLGRARVAGMLGAPLRDDPGQPVALALNDANHAPRMAVAEAASVSAMVQPSETIALADDAELPAVQEPDMPRPAPPLYTQTPRPSSIRTAPVQAPARQVARSTIERAFDGRLTKPRPSAQGRHVVQLGSFLTREGAERAWTIYQRRDPSLRGHSVRITEVQVRGRRYFRVAAEGFERGGAQSLCSSVKHRGGECLAYEAPRAQPAAVPARKAQLAQR